MKRIVSLVLALSMILSMFPVVFAGSSLKDIADTRYEASVEALVELGVVSGYPDGTYLPENVVTRAELAKLLVVADGLLHAAEASNGLTPFADVNAVANHWAAGYVNVAADYKIINGYPDGNFGPEKTVTYAEAITMCLRVLGYTNEVEAKGTWPTNYIAKAQDLKLMKDVDFKSYNDGATRGNIAILIWNMLRTYMWTVTEESEGDGLTYKANAEMLNVKFPDYRYEKEAIFNSFEIKDGEVLVSLSGEKDLEYAGNDFYTFVEGTEVEVLINKEDETLLTMVPTAENNLFEGDAEAFEDKKVTDMDSLTYDYAYATLDKKAADAYTLINVANEYVNEFEIKKDKVYVNGTKHTIADVDSWDDEVILRDGERVEIKDLEVGDVLTTVTVTSSLSDTYSETFYVIGAIEAEGKLTKYVAANSEIVVDGETYTVDSATEYVEDPEDEDEDAKSFVTDGEDDFGKMKNEEVKLILDTIVGKVVRIEFDGKIDEDDDSDNEFKLLAVASKIKRDPNDDTYYFEELENEDGAAPYTIEAGSTLETEFAALWVMKPSMVVGDFWAVMLNDDGNIVDVEQIIEDGEFVYDYDTLEYNADGDEFVFIEARNVSYDEDELGLVSGDTFICETDKDTVLVVVSCDDKDTIATADDVYSIEFLDAEEIEAMRKQDYVVVIKDSADKSGTAKYVVIFEDISDTSDNKVGVVDEDSYVKNELGDMEISVDDEEMIVASTRDLTDTQVIVYTTETNDDDEVELTYVAGLDNDELSSIHDSRHGYVESTTSGRKFTLSGETDPINLDKKSVRDSFEDYTIVLVKVSFDEEKMVDNSPVDMYVANSAEIVDYDNVSINKYDRLSMDTDAEVLFIIRGMDKVD